MKILTLILFLTFFISCSDKESFKTSSNERPKYALENILNYNKEDSIFIESRFADCGEWGGHNEIIKIYRSEQKLKLTYIKFKVDCEIRDSTGSIIQDKKFKKHILLSNSQKLALMKYVNELMKFKFLKDEISHSGNSFALSNTKGDLKISHFGNQPLLLTSYNNLMSSLNLPRVSFENR